MSVLTGDVISSRIVGEVLGTGFVVTQFYKAFQDYVGADAAGVGFDIWETFKAGWRAMQPITALAATVRVDVTVVSRPDGITGTYVIPALEQGGTRSTVAAFLPSFNAAGITLRGASRITRPGSRRIPFLTEDQTSSNTLDPSALGLLATIATDFTQVLVSDNVLVGDYADPVIVGRLPDGNFDFTRVQKIVSAAVNPFVTSQVSRKQGRGI